MVIIDDDNSGRTETITKAVHQDSTSTIVYCTTNEAGFSETLHHQSLEELNRIASEIEINYKLVISVQNIINYAESTQTQMLNGEIIGYVFLKYINHIRTFSAVF